MLRTTSCAILVSFARAAALAASLAGLTPPALASTFARMAAAVAAAAAGSRLGGSGAAPFDGDAALAVALSSSGTKSFAKSAIPSRVSKWKS